MKTLKTRVLSGALAGALALSMATPAFASASKNSTKVTGTYQEITIDVTVPTTGTAQINPYALGIKLPDSTANDDTDNKLIAGQQIVTMPLYVVNNTKMTLDVGATVTGEIKGNFKFATESTKEVKAEDGTVTKAAPTTNSGFVYFEIDASTLVEDDVSTAETAVQGFDVDKVATEFSGWAASTYAVVDADTDADAAAAANKNKILVGTKAATKEQLVQLKPVDDDGNLVAGSVAKFRLTGDCVKAPKTAWAKTDGFTTTIAFTFEPGEAPAGGDGN